jgi:16S rRNA processing protein RimM
MKNNLDPILKHEVGKILAPHGLRGWLRVKCYSDFPERLTTSGEILWIEKGSSWSRLEVMTGQYYPGKDLYLVGFKDILDRTQAESLVGFILFVEDTHRPSLAEDEYYLPDLIGSVVIHQVTRRVLGQVTALIPAGNDLLEITHLSGQKILIPFVKDIVPVVDVNQKKLWVLPPEGLLALYHVGEDPE